MNNHHDALVVYYSSRSGYRRLANNIVSFLFFIFCQSKSLLILISHCHIAQFYQRDLCDILIRGQLHG